MTRAKLPDWLFSVIILAAAFALAMYIRVVLPYSTVFSGPWIKLTGIDAYFYMRLVDNLVRNFPQVISFDPYYMFPDSGGGASLRFFAFLMAGTIRLLGGFAPSQHTVDTIAVYIPAVMGALTVLPAFFIGRALVNRWAGLIAALAVAVMPGELLGRTLLGFTDHHAPEVFFSSFFVMFFILAIKHGRQFIYEMLRKGQFLQAGRHIPYSFIAGIFLWLYLISWRGASLFIFIVFIYFIVQFISDHLRGFPTDYLSKTAITCFLIALLLYVPVSRDKPVLLALAAVILVPIVLNVISAVMAARGVRPIYYLAAVGGLLGLGILVAWFLLPDLFQTAIGESARVFSWKVEQNVIGEDKSLFFPGGSFSLDMAWSEYALALYSGLAALALLIYSSLRRGEPQHIFSVIWSIVIMLASFAMVRFAAYFAVCLAVLTGYLAGYIIEAVSPRREPEALDKPRRKARKTSSGRRSVAGRLATGLAVAVAVIIMLVPGTALAVGQARSPAHAPSDAWMEALDWLRENSPEPFGSADYYYAFYASPDPGKAYEYPGMFYSVVAWSDYGYWITRIGRRIPHTNPATDRIDAALYFTAQDESSPSKLMNQSRARYVIIDNRIASPNDKFYALANLSGKTESDFYELCWQKKGDKYSPLLVFYPEYYRSMVSRLYNFDGRQYTPSNTPVMAWQERETPDGQKFKEITGFKNFKSFAEAEAFVSSQKQGSYRIIGTDPLVSAVPLQALTDYRPVYQSAHKATVGSATSLPAIKIFEYIKPPINMSLRGTQ